MLEVNDTKKGVTLRPSTTEAERVACGDGIKKALFACAVFGGPAAASARQADRCIQRQRGG